jgi:hypothetical protein
VLSSALVLLITSAVYVLLTTYRYVSLNWATIIEAIIDKPQKPALTSPPKDPPAGAASAKGGEAGGASASGGTARERLTSESSADYLQ